MNIKEKILNANDTVGKSLRVDEWDVTVHLKRMTVAETMNFQQTISLGDEDDNTTGLRNMVAFVSTCMCDEQGNRIFSDDELNLLDTRSTDVIQRIFDEAAKLNGMGKDDDGEEAKKS